MSIKKIKVNDKTLYRVDFNVTDNGKTFRRRGNCKLYRDAIALERQFEDEYQRFVSLPQEETGALIRNRFHEFVYASYSNIDTRKGYESKYRNYLDGFYKDNRTSFITRKSMERFRRYVYELTDKNGNEISTSLKQSIWEKNMTFVNWLVERGDIPYGKYFAGLKRFCDPHHSHIKKRWEKEEFEKFINVVDNYTEKTYFIGLYTMGTRKSELNNLKYKDINNISKTWIVEKQYKDKTHGETNLKTENSLREVPMSDLFLQRVERMRKELKKKGLSDEEIDSMHVFLNDKGNVMPKETLRRHFKMYLKKAGMKDIRIHDLRGSFASRMLEETGNAELVRGVLGHSDVVTTMMYITPGEKSFNLIRNLNNQLNISDDVYEDDDEDEENFDSFFEDDEK